VERGQRERGGRLGFVLGRFANRRGGKKREKGRLQWFGLNSNLNFE
jgi:hypothetical protein